MVISPDPKSLRKSPLNDAARKKTIGSQIEIRAWVLLFLTESPEKLELEEDALPGAILSLVSTSSKIRCMITPAMTPLKWGSLTVETADSTSRAACRDTSRSLSIMSFFTWCLHQFLSSVPSGVLKSRHLFGFCSPQNTAANTKFSHRTATQTVSFQTKQAPKQTLVLVFAAVCQSIIYRANLLEIQEQLLSETRKQPQTNSRLGRKRSPYSFVSRNPSRSAIGVSGKT